MAGTGELKLSNTTYSASRPAGEIEGTLECGVCGDAMNVRRDRWGPVFHFDDFTCPHKEERWHHQVIALRHEQKATASQKLADLLEIEINEILKARRHTR